MRKISTLAIAFAFTGCILGAGYVSGQELYQFFAQFGVWGIAGLFLAVGLLAVFNFMIYEIVNKTKDTRIDKTVVGSDNKILLFSVGILENIMFFGTYVVMAAGAGALTKKLSGAEMSHIGGSLIFCIVISVLAIRGIRGLVKIFSAAVPILVAVTLFVGFSAVIIHGGSGFDFTPSDKFNPLIPNWFWGAVTFASYNLFCSIGVLCPIGIQAKSKKSNIVGTFLGCVFLLVVAFSVTFSLAVLPGASAEDLPMLAVAESIAPWLMYAYSALLFIAMSGASLASLIPIVSYTAETSRTMEKHSAAVIFIISAIAFILSCFGFADLVGTVFSLFGYVSLIGVAGIVLHYIKIKRK